MSFILNNKKRETTNKMIRFPNDLIKQIHQVIKKSNITFSRFVIQACEYALKKLYQDQQKPQ